MNKKESADYTDGRRLKNDFMDRLLEGVEVEWKTLGEVAIYEQPTKYLVKNKN